MADTNNLQRRSFLTGAAAGGAAATALAGSPVQIQAQVTVPASVKAGTPQSAPPASPGYLTLTADEAAFVEALLDTMIPADVFSPKGTDVGVNIYIDRALASGWGRGDRLFRQGPWPAGHPNQGFQSALTPNELYKAGIAAANAHCRATFGKTFDQLSDAERNDVLLKFDQGAVTFSSGPPAPLWWGIVYQTVMEGMFADPVHGGNRDKVGWKMIGFPGVIQNNRNNVASYRNRRFDADPVSIADMS